jgi:hypothetical protein
MVVSSLGGGATGSEEDRRGSDCVVAKKSIKVIAFQFPTPYSLESLRVGMQQMFHFQPLVKETKSAVVFTKVFAEELCSLEHYPIITPTKCQSRSLLKTGAI